MQQGAAVEENGDAVPDSARSRVSFAPSDMTDTSLGILNLDDLGKSYFSVRIIIINYISESLQKRQKYLLFIDIS